MYQYPYIIPVFRKAVKIKFDIDECFHIKSNVIAKVFLIHPYSSDETTITDAEYFVIFCHLVYPQALSLFSFFFISYEGTHCYQPWLAGELGLKRHLRNKYVFLGERKTLTTGASLPCIINCNFI